MEKIDLTPREYFLDVKDRLKSRNNKELDEVIFNAQKLASKCMKTGQVKQLNSLIFLMETADKEKDIISMGISKYVLSGDVLNYMDHVADKTVKIIELKNYPREIPDEITDIVEKTKDLFGELYVVFTDYTGEVEKKVAKERRDKDPILFGSFQNKSGEISDKWYFLGDWEDEYCDLTLEKMLSEMKIKKNKDILHETKFPSLEDMKNYIYEKTPKQKKKKVSFFSKVKTFLKHE